MAASEGEESKPVIDRRGFFPLPLSLSETAVCSVITRIGNGVYCPFSCLVLYNMNIYTIISFMHQ